MQTKTCPVKSVTVCRDVPGRPGKPQGVDIKTIKIEVYGGCVTEVSGLPEGYNYEIIDYDQKEAEEDAKKRS